MGRGDAPAGSYGCGCSPSQNPASYRSVRRRAPALRSLCRKPSSVGINMPCLPPGVSVLPVSTSSASALT